MSYNIDLFQNDALSGLYTGEQPARADEEMVQDELEKV
jgi:hypothetical protein